MAISMTSSARTGGSTASGRSTFSKIVTTFARSPGWTQQGPPGGYTPIYTQQNGNIYIYNAWVCDVFFQNGDFKGKGLRMSRWVSDCGGQEEVLSASISGSFQVAISTAMFWRWGHGRWILLNCGTVAASIHFAAEIHGEIHGEIMEYPLSKYFMVFFQSYRNGSPQKYLESIPLH